MCGRNEMRWEMGRRMTNGQEVASVSGLYSVERK